MAQIELMRVEIAKRAENLDEAIARASTAMDGFTARGRLRAQIEAGLGVLELRELRAAPGDLAAAPDKLAAWRRRVISELGDNDELVRSIDAHVARLAFARGDVAAAHAQLAHAERPAASDKLVRIAGVVVDDHGKPVAGALVSAGRALRGDATGAAAAFTERDTLRVTHSDDDGRFAIADAVDDTLVVAELAERRSSPDAVTGLGDAARGQLKLVLEPTSRLEGKVDLAGEAPTNVEIVVKDLARPMAIRYGTFAPVAADGTFAVSGVPRHEVRLFASIAGLSDKAMGGTTLTVREPVVKDIAVSLAKSTRVVHVLVRSTVGVRLPNAEVSVFPGKVTSMSALEMNRQFRGGTSRWARQVDDEHAPKPILNAAQPGDLFATMPDLPDGPATVCAVGLPELLADEELERKIDAHLDKLQMICTPIPDGAEVVTVQVPPFPRL
jgi:hypothetical protein